MRLSNTLTRRVEELPPPPGPIRMYVCGPTVYQRIHVGNARPFVISMWLRTWLRERGYEVTLVENITDVNDKIYNAAPGHSAELARAATQWYREHTDALGLGRPDVEPLATESVPAIVAAIEELVAREFAYAVDGDVYFRVARYPDYGQLSRQRPDQMVDEEPNPRKEDPRDFALWKATKEGEDTSWESPWGWGRPGWHIECSVMAKEHLGSVFEIHGGGLDLVFPHHENELAQSRALGHEFARIWMHNGLLRFTGEKMSKSLGNVVSLEEAIKTWGRETLLVFFLTAHWSKPIDFSEETMEQARAQWEHFRHVGRVVPTGAQVPSWDEFAAALDDDFNTPEALAILHNWRAAGESDLLRNGLSVFGLEIVTIKAPPARAAAGAVPPMVATVEELPKQVADLVEKRRLAREKGNFTEADRLRREIEGHGWEIQDLPDGPRLVPKL
jgi:cysteinyl-tRNA synthetase